jgi:hypothetical protein
MVSFFQFICLLYFSYVIYCWLSNLYWEAYLFFMFKIYWPYKLRELDKIAEELRKEGKRILP